MTKNRRGKLDGTMETSEPTHVHIVPPRSVPSEAVRSSSLQDGEFEQLWDFVMELGDFVLDEEWKLQILDGHTTENR
jgi:hypothetical protein